MVALLVRRGVTHARVNWSRWIADCPSPFCHSALALYREQGWYECLDCPAVAEIVWPNFIDEIERILIMRPDFITRNWNPGENAQDLYGENLEHGVIPDHRLTAEGSDTIFAVDDTRILIDKIPLPPGVRRVKALED